MSTDTLLTITGWTLIAIGVAATVLLVAYRKRPTVRELLTLPDPTPAVQDAIDDGDAFDRAVDEALAVARAGWRLGPVTGAYCSICETRFPATTIRDVASHLRDIHGPTADDFAQWAAELKEDA